MANLLKWNRISEKTYHIDFVKPLTLLEFFKEIETTPGSAFDRWVSIKVNDAIVIDKNDKNITIYQGYEKYSNVKFSACYANNGFWQQMTYSFKKGRND